MNKTEVTKVFEEYVVDETAEAVEGYAGIITGVKVEKSLASNGVISYNDYIDNPTKPCRFWIDWNTKTSILQHFDYAALWIVARFNWGSNILYLD